MQNFRHYLRRFTWIAMFAILGLALAPTISHALNAAGSGTPWAEICSVTAGANGSSAPAAALHLEHCPLCALGAGPLAPPPASALFVVPAGAAVVYAQHTEALRRAWLWAHAQPRGPPVFLLS